ncbi:unnamed protein product, partial [Acanthoscelides obtectus]
RFILLSYCRQQNITTNKCDIPPSAPKRIEEAINCCQDEIKIAILSDSRTQVHEWQKNSIEW